MSERIVGDDSSAVLIVDKELDRPRPFAEMLLRGLENPPA
jgi:hypothetical protein